MTTSIIEILKSYTYNMESQKLSMDEIMDELEFSYDSLGGAPMGRKLLWSMATVWCEESLTKRISEDTDKATGEW